MTAISLHPTPRWRSVAGEQVRAVGLHIRAAGVLLVATLAVFGVLAIRYTVATKSTLYHSPPNFGYTPESSVLVTYFALLIPALMWHDEKPSKRIYHRAMPMAGSNHALTRVFAGWLWTMAATALFLLFVVSIDELARRVGGFPFNSYRQIAAWQWLVPFTSASIAYALSSAAAVGTESPAVWVVGVPMLYWGLAYMLGMFGAPHASAGMFKLFSGYLGAGASMGGTLNGNPVPGQVPTPSISRWIEATALWGAAAAALLYTVSRRRPAA